ncbi:MAG: PAS domain S-box protein [Pseudomonadota bacterium]
MTEAREVSGTLSAFQQALNEQAIVSIADRTGAIRFVNDRFCAINAYAREELLGQEHRVVNSGWHSKGFFRDFWRTISGW